MTASPAPAPVVLAHALAPQLGGLDWAVGGSCLLWRLGIEPAPEDLDLVTTSTHFDSLCATLSRQLGPGKRPSHKRYASTHFLRFGAAPGQRVDVMAGIRVRSAAEGWTWHFDPARVQAINGLPWMLPQDWLTLYTLFDRPQRVARLQAYLSGGNLDPITLRPG